MEEGLCYVNGAFLPASEAKVSIFDRGFTSGEGVMMSRAASATSSSSSTSTSLGSIAP
jgi:hypothetical protein